MKKLYALLIVSLFILGGCSDNKSENASQNSADSTQPSTVEVLIPLYEPDVQYSVPYGFERTSTQSNQTAYLKDDASVIINEDFLTQDTMSLKAYVEYSEELYMKSTDKYEVISREDLSINGFELKILEFVYELNGENGTLSKTCMVGFYSDTENNSDKIYVVTCKADTENYSTYKDDFMKTIKSIRAK